MALLVTTTGTGGALAAGPLTVTAAAATAPAAPQASAPLQHRSSPVAPAGPRSVCAAPASGEAACSLEQAAPTTRGSGLKTHAAGVSPSGLPALSPSDIQSAYNLPANTLGADKTIAVVTSFDVASAESDLATFRSQFGLPNCTTANGCFSRINQRGGSTLPAQRLTSGWPLEHATDLDAVSATCPLCHILLVEADDSQLANLGAAVDQAAASPGVSAIAAPYYTSESGLSAYAADYNHPGIAITAPSGDYSYGSVWPSGPRFPASTPTVVAVGGTTLQKTGGAGRGWAESAWSSSGSACSVEFAKPSFQTDTGCSGRTTADVAAVADATSGLNVYSSDGGGHWSVVGGTGLASLIVAGVAGMAPSAPPSSTPNSFPYANSAALNDITVGANGTCSPTYLCTAGAGYDGPTGLGTPNGIGAFTPPETAGSAWISGDQVFVDGSSVGSATVRTGTIAGPPPTLNLSVAGLPAGVTASISPSVLTAGTAATVTVDITGAGPTGPRSFNALLVADTGTSSVAAPLRVSVAGPPVIDQDLANVTAYQGQSVTLRATSSSYPGSSTGWERSDDGGATWHSINYFMNIDASVTIAVQLTDNGAQIRATFTNSYGQTPTSVATITVLPGLTPYVTSQPASATVVEGQTVSFSVASSGVPTPSVQWLSSTDGVTWGDVTGATSATYTFSPTAADTGKRYEAYLSNGAGSTTSGSATLTVRSIPKITQQPGSTTVPLGQSASFTATATAVPAPTVQWQGSGDNGATWADIAGARSTTYSFVTGAADADHQYRAVFSNAIGSTATNPATLTQATVPVITLQPVSPSGNATFNVTLTAAATGVPTPIPTWQRSDNAGSTWTTDKYNSDSDTIVAGAGVKDVRYRCAYTNLAGTTYSNVVSLANIYYAPQSYTISPANTSKVVGQSITYTIDILANPAPSIQWQYQAPSDPAWIDVPGATTAPWTHTVTAAEHLYNYRAVLTNSVGSTTSPVAHLGVFGPVVITSQPSAFTGAVDTTATFSVAATTTPSVTSVAWWISVDGGKTYNPAAMVIPGLTGTTTASFVIGPRYNGYLFRAVVSNGLLSATSSSAMLTINGPPAISYQPASAIVLPGNSNLFQVGTVGDSPMYYHWQSSADGANWADIDGVIDAFYSVTGSDTTNNTMYRVTVTNASGTVTSDPAMLQVGSLPTIIQQPTATTVPLGTPVTLTAAATSWPSPTVQWQSSTNGGSTYLAISGATSPSYTFTPTLSNNGTLYRASFTNSLGNTKSDAALLGVTSAPTITGNPQSTAITLGSSASFSSSATGSPTLTRQWQVLVGGVWTDLAGATAASYSFTPNFADNGTQFRVVYTNPFGSMASSAATLTVRIPPAVTLQPVSASVAKGASTTFTAAASGSPTPTTQWQYQSPGSSSWFSITGSANALTWPAASVVSDGTLIRAVFTNAAGTATTSSATLHVTQSPTVTKQPSPMWLIVGQTASFTAAGTGTPTPTIQWQHSPDGGSSWISIDGATSATYTLVTTQFDDQKLFRAVFTNNTGVVTTTPVVLGVALPDAPTAADTTVTFGGPGAYSASAPGLLALIGGTGVGITGHSDPAHGTLALNADGSYAYTPAIGFAGPDSFTYIVTDAYGRTASGTVSITVVPPAPPTVAGSALTVVGTIPGSVAAPGVLAGSTGTAVTITSSTQPTHGSATVAVDGAYTYTAAAGWYGPDAFTFTATDAYGQTATGTVLVNVNQPTPFVSCAAPDQTWHKGDVTLQCVSVDRAPGLANPADASFTLSTHASSGTASTNAATDSHQVCDTLGNCVLAGPVAGNWVDKAPPTNTVSTPAAGALYGLGSPATVSFGCTDAGSGLADCVGSLASGAALDTTTVGPKSVTITSHDAVGNVTTSTVSYTVAGASVSGQVLDPTSGDAPVSAANVRLYLNNAANPTVVTTTGADGRYSFANLPVGSWQLQFAKPGYNTDWYKGATNRTLALRFNLAGGQSFVASDPLPRTGYPVTATLSGQLTTGGATPVAGATVAAYAAGASAPTQTVTTGTDGHYSISSLTPGTWELQFSKTGYTSRWYLAAATRAADTPVTLTAGQAATANDQLMPVPVATLGGTVSSQSTGTGLSGATVAIYPAGSTTALATLTTASDGTWSTVGIAPGNYQVQITASGYLGAWYLNALSQSTSTTVTIPSGGNVLINQLLAPAPLPVQDVVSGTVTAAAGGAPITAVNVRAWLVGASNYFAATTSAANGKYSLGLPPGTYQLQFAKPGNSTLWYLNAAIRANATVIVLANGDTRTINAALT